MFLHVYGRENRVFLQQTKLVYIMQNFKTFIYTIMRQLRLQSYDNHLSYIYAHFSYCVLTCLIWDQVKQKMLFLILWSFTCSDIVQAYSNQYIPTYLLMCLLTHYNPLSNCIFYWINNYSWSVTHRGQGSASITSVARSPVVMWQNIDGNWSCCQYLKMFVTEIEIKDKL